MKKFWKVLGAAALIAGFAPYQVEKNERTGEKKVKALLWQATKKPSSCGDKDDITIKFLSFGKDEEETPLFDEEFTLEYGGAAASAAEDAGDEAAEEAVEAGVEPEVSADVQADVDVDVEANVDAEAGLEPEEP